MLEFLRKFFDYQGYQEVMNEYENLKNSYSDGFYYYINENQLTLDTYQTKNQVVSSAAIIKSYDSKIKEYNEIRIKYKEGLRLFCWHNNIRLENFDYIKYGSQFNKIKEYHFAYISFNEIKNKNPFAFKRIFKSVENYDMYAINDIIFNKFEVESLNAALERINNIYNQYKAECKYLFVEENINGYEQASKYLQKYLSIDELKIFYNEERLKKYHDILTEYNNILKFFYNAVCALFGDNITDCIQTKEKIISSKEEILNVDQTLKEFNILLKNKAEEIEIYFQTKIEFLTFSQKKHIVNNPDLLKDIKNILDEYNKIIYEYQNELVIAYPNIKDFQNINYETKRNIYDSKAKLISIKEKLTAFEQLIEKYELEIEIYFNEKIKNLTYYQKETSLLHIEDFEDIKFINDTFKKLWGKYKNAIIEKYKFSNITEYNFELKKEIIQIGNELKEINIILKESDKIISEYPIELKIACPGITDFQTLSYQTKKNIYETKNQLLNIREKLTAFDELTKKYKTEIEIYFKTKIQDLSYFQKEASLLHIEDFENIKFINDRFKEFWKKYKNAIIEKYEFSNIAKYNFELKSEIVQLEKKLEKLENIIQEFNSLQKIYQKELEIYFNKNIEYFSLKDKEKALQIKEELNDINDNLTLFNDLLNKYPTVINEIIGDNRDYSNIKLIINKKEELLDIEKKITEYNKIAIKYTKGLRCIILSKDKIKIEEDNNIKYNNKNKLLLLSIDEKITLLQYKDEIIRLNEFLQNLNINNLISTYPNIWKIIKKKYRLNTYKDLLKIPTQELSQLTDENISIKYNFIKYVNDKKISSNLIYILTGFDINQHYSSFDNDIILSEKSFTNITTRRILQNIKGKVNFIDNITYLIKDNDNLSAKKCILNSELYGSNVNFVDSYQINEFISLAELINDYKKSFDEIQKYRIQNQNAIKAYNKENGNDAKLYIEDFLLLANNNSDIYAYIEEYKDNTEQRDLAKSIKRDYSDEFNYFFDSNINLDTCEINYIKDIIRSKNKIIERYNQRKEREKQEHARRIFNDCKDILSTEYNIYSFNNVDYNWLISNELYLNRRQREINDIKNTANTLRTRVQNWDCLSYGLNYKYFYDYYPYGLYKNNATQSMRNTWNIVWAFKNDPDKNASFSNNYARTIVKNEIKQIIRDTFGYETNKLTLVCIPASTKIKNNARYKVFAKELCDELNMNNAFDYIGYINDGEAKHTGGSKGADIYFNTSYFKDKYIILFDDIITSGGSMIKFKNKLESLGAHVICAMSIGKTKHH